MLLRLVWALFLFARPSEAFSAHPLVPTDIKLSKASASLMGQASSSSGEDVNEQQTVKKASRLAGFDAPTVWHEFTPLAKEYGACNLGQGFPDWPCPNFAKDAIKRAVDNDLNQYTRSGGHPALMEVLAETYSPLLGRRLDPMTEVTAAVGASEALFAAFQALLGPGDEAVLLEPAFDIYAAQVQMAGAKSVHVPLRPAPGGNWALDPAELAAALTPRAKVLVLNTPHNPTGKVFTRAELEAIAEIVQRYPQLVVVTDEVYENILYGNAVHERMATINGMWDRTLTISSAGKTFSLTGWKVGWLIGPEPLIRAVMEVNQWVQFSVPTPNQQAVADILVEARRPYRGHPDFYAHLRAEYARKKEVLCAALVSAGITPLKVEGGIFVMGDTSSLEVPEKYTSKGTAACPEMTRDWAFCRWLTIEKGVAAIPPSAFYCKEHKALAGNYARFAICKTDETLEESTKRLQRVQVQSVVEQEDASIML